MFEKPANFSYILYRMIEYFVLMLSRQSLRLRIYLSILIGVFIIGMIGLIYFEKFPPLDAFYFFVTTISTVGLGDLHPITPEGKILVIFIILIGVGCFVGVVANAIELLIDERERRQRFEKLNMIIGAFFSEMGTNLLKKFSLTILGLRRSVLV